KSTKGGEDTTEFDTQDGDHIIVKHHTSGGDDIIERHTGQQDIVRHTQGGEDTAEFDTKGGDHVTVKHHTSGGDDITCKHKCVADDTFTFTTSGIPLPLSFTITTSSGTGTKSFDSLPSGIYTVSESSKAGWTPTGATCDNGDIPSTGIHLGAGKTVTCTFTNTKQPNNKIIIVKQTSCNDDIVKSTKGGEDTTEFDTQDGDHIIVKHHTSGGDDIIERHTGQQDIVRHTQGGEDTAEFDTKGGDHVTVKHHTSGGDDITCKHKCVADDTFTFTTTIGSSSSSFTITTSSGTGTKSFDSLPSGIYTVSESSKTGWDLTGATCDNGDIPSTGIHLGAGKTVTCTFTNTKQNSKIIIVKQTSCNDDIVKSTKG